MSYDHQWPDYVGGGTPTSSSLVADNSESVSTSPSRVQDVVAPTSHPVVSLIQITALPPAKTLPQAVLPKRPYHRQLNVLYLVPLFIALGIVLGALTTIMLLKWGETRRRLHRTPSLLPGPPYGAQENGIEDRLLVHGYPSMEQVSLFAATPSKHTIHGSRYAPKRSFAWQTLDLPQSYYPRSIHTQTIIPSSDGERFTVVAEQDPFSTTSPKVTARLPQSLNDPSLSQLRASPSPLDHVSGIHTADRRVGLPKPFRRSMFDILKLKGPIHPAPIVREEYTVLVLDEEPADAVPSNDEHRASGSTMEYTRKHQSHTSLVGHLDIGDIEEALGSPGSLQKEDAPDAPVVLPDITSGLEDCALSSLNRAEDPELTMFCGDKLTTKAHPRRSATFHETSPRGASRQSFTPDIHLSVPSLSSSSPSREKSRFFASSLSSSPPFANSMGAPPSIHSPSSTRSPELSLFSLPSSEMKFTGREPQTERPEPPLPFPSYPDLAQETPQSGPTSTNIKQRLVSPSYPRPRSTSSEATHRESTSLAPLLSQTSLGIVLASSSSSDPLSKVNDIVAQGYSKRAVA